MRRAVTRLFSTAATAASPEASSQHISATATAATKSYPAMMHVPPKITFYPEHIRRFYGHGAVNYRLVTIYVTVGLAVSAVLHWVSDYVSVKVGGPPPRTLTPEWKRATEEMRIKYAADPISRHKIGEPAEIPDVKDLIGRFQYSQKDKDN